MRNPRRLGLWLGAAVLAVALTVGFAWALRGADTPSGGGERETGPGVADPSPGSSGGGAVERSQVNEGVEYIIRDAKGRIKERKVVGGR